MRKSIAVMAIAVCFSFCVVTLAQADSRTADTGAPAARSDARERLTIQRLLRDRIEFTLRLARAMSFLEPPAPVEQPIGTTNGIIDEPDPAGNRFQRDNEEERDSRRRRHQEETMNSGTIDGVPVEMTFHN